MQIIINTISGTYIVPPEKEASLIMWLDQNAIKAGQQSVFENNPQSRHSGRTLLSEDLGREF